MITNNLTLVHHFPEESAKFFPDKIALIHEDIRASYREINSLSNHLAYWLTKHGVTIGDRVVIILENSLEYVVSYYGILKTGAIAVPLSSDLKPDGLEPLLEELEPKVIISSSRFENVLQKTNLSSCSVQALILRDPKLEWHGASFSVFPWSDVIKNGESSNIDIQIEGDELASIIYTSGSTGKPKGVMLSHNNIVENTKSICQYLHITDKDIQMIVLPFFYVMGKSLLNSHFAAGGAVVINNKFAFPATVVKQLVEEKVTGFSGVPSTFAYLLHRSPLEKYRDKLVSLRYCAQAGGHMSRQIKEELRRALPQYTQIYIMYGATEASARLTYLEPERFNDKIESIGKAIPGVTIKVLDEKGQVVSTGEIGEIVGCGPNIMQGYWKDEQATASVLGQDSYFTGDLGYRDEEGFLFLTGRKDNLLKVGGHRINPQEIEEALMNTELIIEAVVLGVPDELLGNRLIAIASPVNKDISENEILAQCAERLPRYKLPAEIKLIRSIPKKASGKIDKDKCFELISK